LNALAALAVGRELRLSWDEMAAGLKSFQGAERRFQRRGEENGVSVVEDYGHHPTEIAAVIAAARPIAAKGRLVVVFQPHRFSRTQALMNEFGPAFAGADAVFLTDIYSAGEDAIAGVDADTLAAAVRGAFSGDVRVVKALADLPAALAQSAAPGDLIVLLGAGSIGSVAPRVLQELGKGTRH
jgi:UDP-N-acetylmuramate--alanine ligase